MGLFREKGRSDIDAWAKVMIQGYIKGMPIDKAVLEQATDQSIRNDCRIIRESVQIVMRSSDYEVREKRKKLIEGRYQHLNTLLPFADADQLKLYDEAMDQIDCLNQQIESRNMIGVKKQVIIVNMGFVDIVMFNPVLLSKDTPYETEEGCLSLTGARKTTRYENIEVEYYDMNWKKQRQKLSGWPAQICQHELDHLEGILI